MLMPSIFSNDFMDDFFSVPRVTGFGHSYDNDFSRMMTTDVKENENGYQVDMNLPGFAKEDIKAELKDGYLTIKGERKLSKEGKLVRGERVYGKYSRSFYIGDVKKEDVKAQFVDGVLSLSWNKVDPKEEDKIKRIEIQ